MPHNLNGVVLAAALTEILGGFFIAAVAVGCHRSYPRAHLMPWAVSALAATLAELVSVASALRLGLGPGIGPAVTLTIILARAIQLAALVVGTLAFLGRASQGVREPRVQAAAALPLLGLALFLVPGGQRWAALVTVAASGIVLAACGLAIERSTPPPPNEGHHLIGGVMLIFALERVHRVVVQSVWLLGGPFLQYALYSSFLRAALAGASGVGLVLALVEDEYRRAARAESEGRAREGELARERDRLRASEEKFAKVFLSSPDSVTVSAPHQEGGHFVDVNAGFERLFGYTAPEAIGRTTLDLALWERPESLQEAMRVFAEKGRLEAWETTLRTKTGESRTCLVWSEAVEIDGVSHAVTVARDITGQRLAEQRVRESAERLRLALSAAELGVWEWNVESGAVTWAGETHAVMARAGAAAPATYASFLDLVHADDRPRVLQAVDDALAQPAGSLRVEYRWASAGPPTWLEATGRVHRGALGEPVLVRGTLADVSARKAAEEALRESQERWRRISEATFEGVAFSSEGVIVDANAQLADMLGYTPGELIGRPVSDCVAPEDRARVMEAIRSGHTGAYQHHALRKDGSTFPVETRARALAGGRLTAVRDVSERQRLEAELRRRETLAAMGSLVAAVAHEVRTPLFSLSATLDALETRVGTPAQRQELEGLFRSQLKRLSNLMEDLLDYGRPAALRLAPCALAEAVAGAARSCAALAANAGVAVRVDVPEGLPQVHADNARLEQVFQNLLANAVQHSRPGATVSVSLRGETGGLVCAVEDQGPGLQPADLERVFEPFFSRRKGGTGMGLAIAQRVVEAHHGSLTAANLPSGGARFAVFLPTSSGGARV